jgi:PadR family transcriptional regulator PadR
MSRRPSRQTVAVLTALAADPATWRYGYELGQQVSLKAGSLYPILMRLGDRGLLEHTWEAAAPGGRPPRHLYRLTADGIQFAAEAAQGTRQAGRPTGEPRRAGELQSAGESRDLGERRRPGQLRQAW